MFPGIEIPFIVLNVHNNGFFVHFDGIKSFSNYFKIFTGLTLEGYKAQLCYLTLEFRGASTIETFYLQSSIGPFLL